MTKKQPHSPKDKDYLPAMDLLKGINFKLSAVLLAYVRSVNNKGLQIEILRTSGLDWEKTAEIIGMSVDTARSTYNRYKNTLFSKKSAKKK